MREKPILFSAPMVQAILSGAKCQTRRIIKPQPGTGISENPYHRPDGLWIWTMCGGVGVSLPFSCPYQPGDCLWVRETWAFIDNLNAGVGSDQYYEYKADTNNPLPGEWPIEEKEGTTLRWKPSIHMPKAAARIWLEVTNVRVERLQEITEDDARAEGVRDPYDYQAPEYYEQHHMKGLEINTAAFAGLWDSLNAKRGYGWDTNPWVWVIEFRRL